MDRARKLLVAGSLIGAVFVPLAVFGQSWFIERPLGPGLKGLFWGAGFGHRNLAGCRAASILEADVDQLAEKLDLTYEEVEQVKALIEEAKPLKEGLQGKMEEIQAIIGPKIHQKLEERREECKGILDQARETVREIWDLRSELKKIETEGNAEQVEQLKAQIEAKKEELKGLWQQVKESDCGPVIGRCWEVKYVPLGRRMGPWGAWGVGPFGKWWQDLSEEDQGKLKSLAEDLRSVAQEIRGLMGKGSQEEFNAVAAKLADMLYQMSEFMKEKGITLPQCGQSP